MKYTNFDDEIYSIPVRTEEKITIKGLIISLLVLWGMFVTIVAYVVIFK